MWRSRGAGSSEVNSTHPSILFDLDNTLINFLSFKVETAKAAAKAMVRHGLLPHRA